MQFYESIIQKEINIKKQPLVKNYTWRDKWHNSQANIQLFNLTSFIISKSLFSKDQQKGQ